MRIIINFQLPSGCQDLIAIEVIFILGGMALFGCGRRACRNPHRVTKQHAKAIKIFVEKKAVKYGTGKQLTIILQNTGTQERNIRPALEDIRDTRCIEIGYRGPYTGPYPKISGNSIAYHHQPLSYNSNEQAIRPIMQGGNFVL